MAGFLDGFQNRLHSVGPCKRPWLVSLITAGLAVFLVTSIAFMLHQAGMRMHRGQSEFSKAFVNSTAFHAVPDQCNGSSTCGSPLPDSFSTTSHISSAAKQKVEPSLLSRPAPPYPPVVPSSMAGSTKQAAGTAGNQPAQASHQFRASQCPAHYPWIPRALEMFFRPAEETAATSKQTSRECLQVIKGIRWSNDYPPGMDEVVLRHNTTARRYTMHIQRVHKPNEPFKPLGMLGVLAAAVERFGADMVRAIGGREVRLIVETEDFPLVWRSSQWRLPAFAQCADSEHTDIPVPDFTYGLYPAIKYTNTSWAAVRELLALKGRMLGWHGRYNKLFMRAHQGVGPRKHLMPLLKAMQGVNDSQLLGAELDVEDTGYQQNLQQAYEALDRQCEYRYLLHTAGFSYSAGLKYKLACGSLVFKFENKHVEFYEPGLTPGVHYISLSEGAEEFANITVPAIRQALAANDSFQQAIAAGGQRFVARQLDEDALSCYWFMAIERYAKLYLDASVP